MIQILGLWFLLVCSSLAESELSSLSSDTDSGFCHQGVCNDVESILRGPVYQLGNFEDCVYTRKQQYCLANIHLYPGDTPSHFWFHIQNMTSVRTHFRRDILYVGTCVPESSTPEDVSMAMVDMLEPAAASLGVRAVIKVESSNCQTRYHTPITTGDVFFGVFVCAIVIAVISGTLLDSESNEKDHQEDKSTEISTGQEVLLCFSLTRNWKKMVACNSSRTLSSIEGLRTIFAFIAVLMHAGFFILNGAVSNMAWLEKAYGSRYSVMLVHVHTHIVCFICLSGFLAGYISTKRMTTREFTFTHYVQTIWRRYLRFTPVAITLVAMAATWLNHFGSGPLWPTIVTAEVENCRRNWWTNLFYVNNYIHSDKLCLIHTWYIASDFQNYVVSLFVLMMAHKSHKWGKVITAVALFTYIIVPFLQTYIERLDPTFLYIPEIIRHVRGNPTYLKNYITFHGNAAAYFVGVIFGSMFFKVNKQGNVLSKMSVVILWTLAVGIPLSTVFTFYELYRPDYEYNVLAVSLYAALHKPIYAVGVGSILLGCSAGYGWIFRSMFSWKHFQTIAPLTYGIYLTHFIMQRIATGSATEPVTMSIAYILNKAIFDFVIAMGLGLVLHLFIQLPVENLLDMKPRSGLEKEKSSFSALINVKQYVQKLFSYK